MVVVGLAVAVVEVIQTSSPWAEFVSDLPPMVDVLAIRVLMVLVALVVVGSAVALGAKRREVYFEVGELDGATNLRRKDGTPVPWTRFGPVAVVLLMFLMLWFTFPLLPDQVDLLGALPFIAVGAIAALCNAFWEEAAFRAAPLSMLQRAVGPGAGVLILAVWFGLGHYFGGVPSGLMGAVASGSLAVLFGRAMIETRGMAWPVGLHFAGDLVIFTVLALAAAA
jgi:membrane protease YdiL (CAAX protease family)